MQSGTMKSNTMQSGTMHYCPETAGAAEVHGRAHAKLPPRAAQVSKFHRFKAIVDRPLAAILLIPALPVISLLWLLIRVGSPGPGFYRQKRVGLHGRTFYILKLRSMREDAEAGSGAVWCATHDPRITRLGMALRKFHLDELPQLLNVLRGEMSLVGPRPERPEFVEVLAEQLQGYRQRLAVLPGITGLAQLNLPPDTDLTSVARKLVLDLQYIEQANLWLEARLLMSTASRLVKIPTIGLLGVRRSVGIHDTHKHYSESTECSEAHDTIEAEGMAATTIRARARSNGKKRGGSHAPHDTNSLSPR